MDHQIQKTDRDEMLARIKTMLGVRIFNWYEKNPRRIYAEAKAEDILAVASVLFKELGARLSIASGADTPEAIEFLYHWAFDACNFIFTVRVKLDRDQPEIESLANLFKGAEWIERETWELLGIQFRHHPNLRHLLLADDWPEGRYPLRRDYQREPQVNAAKKIENKK